METSNYLHFYNILPILLLPFLGLLATFNFHWTICIILFTLILLYAMYFISNIIYNSMDKFFYSWTIMSVLTICSIYQLVLTPLQIISTWENIFFFLTLFMCIWYMHKVKTYALLSHVTTNCKGDAYDKDNISLELSSLPNHECQKSLLRTYHCGICKVCILKRHLHSIWLDCCIGLHNHRAYLVTLILLVTWLIFTSYLMLTAVCHPIIVYNSLLVPNDCTEVYNEIRHSICFICGLYSFIIGMVPLILMAYEIWIISTGLTHHEMKMLNGDSSKCCKKLRESITRGILKNWLYFMNSKI